MATLLTLAPTGSARAQTSAEAPPVEAEAQATDEVEAAGDAEATAELAEARRRFEQGVALARAGNCDGAIAEFNASLELVRRPVTLYNIAQCQERLHRYDLALATYRAYLDEAPTDASDRGAVENTMRLLGSLLGRLRLQTNVPAEVWIDDRQRGQAPGEVLVPGGRHVVELRAEGYLPARREVEVAGGREAALEVTLEPARQEVTILEHTTERTRINLAYFSVAAALTVVAAAVAVGFGAEALSRRAEVADLDARLRRPQDLEQIEDAALIADVFWGVAGGLAAVAVVLAILTDWDGDGQDEQGRSRPTLRHGPTVAGVALGWSL